MPPHPDSPETYVAVIIVDEDREFVRADAAAGAMFGADVDTLTRMRLDEFVPCRGSFELVWQRVRTDRVLVSSHPFVGPRGVRQVPFVAAADPETGMQAWLFLVGLLSREDSLPLTQREREVVALVAAGATSGEIGAELRLAYDTVQSHIRNARRRLGARNRAHLASLAIAHGEVDLALLLGWSRRVAEVEGGRRGAAQ
jgi:DNA-binding CsgD family transcriptional regulator